MRIFLFALFVAIPALPLSAATVVNSLAAFNAEIDNGPTETYTFPINTANSVSIDFGAFTTTMSNPDPGTIHRVVNERFLFQLDDPITNVDTMLTMEFDAQIFGLGFDAEGIEQIDISIDGGLTFFDISDAIGGAPGEAGFFGIVGDGGFTTVIFDIIGPGGDGGLLDNLVYTTGPVPSPVPLPASAFLLGASLLGFGAFRRTG